jgi:HEAT repeat protein
MGQQTHRAAERDEFKARLNAAANMFPPGPGREQAKRNLRVLLKAGVDSFPSLLSLIEDNQAPAARRSIACWLAGRLGSKRAAPSLLAALRSSDKVLTWEAATSLASLMAKRAVTPLINELLSAPSPARRAA